MGPVPPGPQGLSCRRVGGPAPSHLPQGLCATPPRAVAAWASLRSLALGPALVSGESWLPGPTPAQAGPSLCSPLWPGRGIPHQPQPPGQHQRGARRPQASGASHLPSATTTGTTVAHLKATGPPSRLQPRCTPSHPPCTPDLPSLAAPSLALLGRHET